MQQKGEDRRGAGRGEKCVLLKIENIDVIDVVK